NDVPQGPSTGFDEDWEQQHRIYELEDVDGLSAYSYIDKGGCWSIDPSNAMAECVHVITRQETELSLGTNVAPDVHAYRKVTYHTWRDDPNTSDLNYFREYVLCESPLHGQAF